MEKETETRPIEPNPGITEGEAAWFITNLQTVIDQVEEEKRIEKMKIFEEKDHTKSSTIWKIVGIVALAGTIWLLITFLLSITFIHMGFV